MCYHSLMGRLPNFDYTSPFFYMVTLHAKEGIKPFSYLSAETESGLKSTPVTRRMKGVLFWMNQKRWVNQMKIHHFSIMPNHLHLIIRINEGPKRPSLIAIMESLIIPLSHAYYDALGLPRGDSIFEKVWHDWVVRHEGMLDTFVTYVRTNARRALYRREAAGSCFPRTTQTPHFTWTTLGTLSVKETPVRVPVICSRTILPESDLWEAWRTFAQRLGPGTLAIGTFMSPCEKMVYKEVLKAGGGIVHLIPRGISPKGHATPLEEPLLAAGT